VGERSRNDAERFPSLTQPGGTARPENKGIGSTAVWVLTLPLLWAPTLLYCVAMEIVLWLSRRRNPTNAANPVDLETLAALLVIPISTTVATIGTSYAFYLWTKSGAAHHRTALAVFNTTVAVALLLPIAWFRIIARHKSGKDPLPFEPDVDPQQGIAALSRLRCKPFGGFLPACGRLVVERAGGAEAPEYQPKDPRFREFIRRVAAGKTDRIQLIAIASSACAWVVGDAIRGGHWWRMVAAVVASLILIVLATILTACVAYWDRVRWARRSAELSRLISQTADADAHFAALAEKIEDLTAEVRALRDVTETHSRRRPRWLRHKARPE
jgi:hypothetical protein